MRTQMHLTMCLLELTPSWHQNPPLTPPTFQLLLLLNKKTWGMIMSPLLEILSPSMQNLGGPLKLLLPSFLPSFLLVIRIGDGTYSAHEIGAPPKTKTNLVQRLLVQFGHGDSITPSFVAPIVVTIYFFKIQLTYGSCQGTNLQFCFVVFLEIIFLLGSWLLLH